MDLTKRWLCALVGVCFADAITMLTGCASFPSPASSRQFWQSSSAAASYAVPRSSPEGQVALHFFGLEDDDLGRTYLHLQMAVTNDSPRPWRVDARQLIAVVPVAGYERAAYAGSYPSAPPEVRIPAGSHAVVDLLFPLSGTSEDIEALGQFDFIWCVDAEGPLACERTTFDTDATQPEGTAFPPAKLLFWRNDGPDVRLPRL